MIPTESASTNIRAMQALAVTRRALWRPTTGQQACLNIPSAIFPSRSIGQMSSVRPVTHGLNTHACNTLWPFQRGPYVVALVPDERSKPPLSETTRAFGERVRNRRVALGPSQEAAAMRCGIHWTQLGKVERGQRSLRLETIVKIAHGLDIEAGDLVSGLPLPPEESVCAPP